ncbi:MAG: hypothetical protein ABIN97_00745 [Ginsengibacter sp.]
MDTKLIQQYGEDILCYRLRTATQKKRMQYEDFNKRLIQLHKEEISLYQHQSNLGWEPLYSPVQKGWKRFFVLGDDVSRSKHAEFFQNILNKINTYGWSHRKDFMIKKRSFGRKKYAVKPQKLLEPSELHFAKLDFNDREKQMFHEEFNYEKWNKGFVKKYVFSEQWRFVLRVKPNVITKVKKRDEVIESRLKWIDNYLERNDYRKKQNWLLHGHYQWIGRKGFEKYNEENPLENKPIERILDEIIVL